MSEIELTFQLQTQWASESLPVLSPHAAKQETVHWLTRESFNLSQRAMSFTWNDCRLCYLIKRHI